MLATVAEDHVLTTVEILPAHLSALVVLAIAWVVMGGVATVSLMILKLTNTLC